MRKLLALMAAGCLLISGCGHVPSNEPVRVSPSPTPAGDIETAVISEEAEGEENEGDKDEGRIGYFSSKIYSELNELLPKVIEGIDNQGEKIGYLIKEGDLPEGPFHIFTPEYSDLVYLTSRKAMAYDVECFSAPYPSPFGASADRISGLLAELTKVINGSDAAIRKWTEKGDVYRYTAISNFQEYETRLDEIRAGLVEAMYELKTEAERYQLP
jgi:hypothetical protein